MNNDWKLHRLLKGKSATPPALDAGQDRIIARKTPWLRYGLIAAAVIAVAGAAYWLMPRGGAVYRAPRNQLTIASVTEGPFEDYIAVRGNVAPLITAYLTTEQGGSVKQVLVEDGAMVKKGQALVVLSNPALQLQVASQQLVFEQSRFKFQQDLLDIQHQLDKLSADIERDKGLLAGGALAASTLRQEKQALEYYKQLQTATIAAHQNEEKVRATQLNGEAASGSADINRAGVEALTIRAPMDGQLTALDAEIGQSKTQGAVLGQVNSADRFKLIAQVDEFYLGQVTVGQEARFTIDGREYRAKVAKVYPQVTNGTFRTDLYFQGTSANGIPGGIHVGQSIDLRIELGGARPARMLPNGPFYQDTGGAFVFAVTPDGNSAIRRNVRLGRRNPEFVEVVEGLEPGERVIVSGYQAFLKMDRVEFSNPQQ
ncbi:MAG TPA: HlyD family efflux transporter periplasmic adaptor subunit [Rhizomicrobium sp.]|nr:HlyD family efflux transporter periplasmic adaptor subunit [Rhizomicrobium sp.]